MSLSPILDLPVNAALLEVPSNGSVLAVLEIKPQGEQLGVVQLVHGFTGSKEDFWDLAPLLAKAGYHVISHDHRGHNQSTHADVSTYTLNQFADDVIAVQDALAIEKVHLLGHSFGGLVSRLAAIKHPDRFESFTLFCTGPGPTSTVHRIANLQKFMRGKTMLETWNALRDNPDSEIAFGPNDSWPAHIFKRWTSTDPEALMATVDMIVNEPDRTDELKNTGINFHAVYGEFDDAWSPAEQDAVAARLGAPVSVISGCGHCPNEEDPVQTVKILTSFWNK